MTALIVDYGMGNIGSVKRAVEECGYRANVSGDPGQVKGHQRVILPGVGSFCDGMQHLKEIGFDAALKEFAAKPGNRLIGVCLGMQLLADEGEEGGITKGLGLIPGSIVRLKTNDKALRLPHVGWNDVIWSRSDVLSDGIQDGSDFYFVHSYQFIPKDDKDIVGKTYYGDSVVAAISRGNIYGVQFHPEKSSKTGLTLINNFLGAAC